MSVFSPDSRVKIVFDCATDTGFVFASLGSSPPKMLNELNFINTVVLYYNRQLQSTYVRPPGGLSTFEVGRSTDPYVLLLIFLSIFFLYFSSFLQIRVSF